MEVYLGTRRIEENGKTIYVPMPLLTVLGDKPKPITDEQLDLLDSSMKTVPELSMYREFLSAVPEQDIVVTFNQMYTEE